MRNAGDGTPGGSTGRRQRVPVATARPTGNGGASLFTPAYRVRHATPDQASREQATTEYGTNRGDQFRWSELDRPSDRQTPSYRHTDYASGQGTSPWADEGSGYSWMTDDRDGSSWPGYSGDSAKFSSAIRGFPPAPDEPLPVYPPGPFAAWNRSASDRGASDRGASDRGASDRGDSRSSVADRFDVPSHSRPMTREDSARMAATITPDEFDTNHSMPAIKDPILTKDGNASAAADHRRAPAAHSRPASPRGRSATSGGDSRTATGPGRPVVAGSRATATGGRAAASSHGRRASRSKRGSKRQPVRLAIGVAVVIIAAVAVILAISSLGKSGPKSAANSRPRTTASTPGAPAGKWAFIGTRQTDPVPLALKELFPGAFATRGVYYHVTITKEGSNCRTALIGAALQSAVRRGGCSQVLRASYVSHVERAMATIGVFNLVTATAARTAAQHAGPSEFVAELPTRRGVTSKIGQGSGIEEALVEGHYLVLVWAENVDLSAPKTSAQRRHLTDFMSTLIQATADNGLSYRMVDGKPSPPA